MRLGMANMVRPRALAAAFGIYFLVVAYFAWTFSNSLKSVWFPADITRWIYTTYMLVAAIFLVGLGGLGWSVRRSFNRQIREIDTWIARGAPVAYESLPPPLPETTVARDHVDRDIDELLESLTEVEVSAAKESQAMEAPGVAQAAFEQAGPELAEKRERLVTRQRFVGRFLAGPGLVAAVVLGVSGMMLPGSDSFAQGQFILNTALILGISYSWLGIGGYIVATIVALVSSKGDRRKT